MKAVVAGLAALVLLTGCSARAGLPYAREMGEMALMRAMGLDRTEDGVELTVAAAETGDKEALVLSARGVSLPAASLAVQSLGSRYVYYGHVDQLLLSENMAVEGLGGLMDYLAREPELGLGVQLWVVRAGSAGQAIRGAGDQGISGRLDQLRTDGQLGAAGMGHSASELMTVMARGGSTWLPALELRPARQADGGGGEVTLHPGGYAILRAGKLVCWTEEDTSRGLELMCGKGAGRVTDLLVSGDTGVSLKVTDVRTGCRPVFQEGELTGLVVTCDLSARVAQTERALEEDELDRLQEALEEVEGERVVRVLELAQYWDADFLGLQHRAMIACPWHKAALEEQWNDAFRGLAVQVQMRAEVERTVGVKK